MYLKWTSNFEHPQGFYFIIQDDQTTSYYLYVYENVSLYQEDLDEKNAICSRHQRDHTQDTLEIAKQQALEDFGVPLESWVAAEE